MSTANPHAAVETAIVEVAKDLAGAVLEDTQQQLLQTEAVLEGVIAAVTESTIGEKLDELQKSDDELEQEFLLWQENIRGDLLSLQSVVSDLQAQVAALTLLVTPPTLTLPPMPLEVPPLETPPPMETPPANPPPNAPIENEPPRKRGKVFL